MLAFRTRADFRSRRNVVTTLMLLGRAAHRGLK